MITLRFILVQVLDLLRYGIPGAVGLSGFTPLGLPQNAHNLFVTIRFVFHRGAPYRQTWTRAAAGSTI